MTLSQQVLQNSKVHKEITKSIEDGLKAININGVVESFSCLLIADIQNKIQNDSLVITSSENQARRVFDQLKNHSSTEVLYFPKKELMMSHIFTESKELLWDRVASVNRLVFDKHPIIVVTSIEALMYRLIPLEDWKKNFIQLEVGLGLSFEKIKKDLVQMGYERVELTETPGHFSIRGGILDLFPPDMDKPLRIEFFGDEVDSIRFYEVETQKSIEKMNSVQINPSVEGIFTKETTDELLRSLDDVRFIEEIKSGLHHNHLDQLIPYVYDKTYTIVDYLNQPQLYFFDSQKVMERFEHIHDDFVERFKDLLGRKEVLPKQSQIIITKQHLLKTIKKSQMLSLNSFSTLSDNLIFDEEISFKIGTVNEYFGKLDVLFTDLENFRHRGYRIIIAMNDDEKITLIKKAAKETGYLFDYFDGIGENLMSTQSALIKANFETGFAILTTKTIVLTEHEIFGQRKKKRIKRFNEKSKMIKSFRELKEGDYVVHESHGIGKYIGINQVEFESIKKDYLKIRYQNDEYLYIPIEQMQSIQKYVGGDAEKVKTHKLGTGEWQKTKVRAKKAIDDMADELIELYSMRMNQKGYAFSEETDWQREFESLFPYEETADQLKSIEEIKRDMEKEVPMDRLLCGDVGYGKTEVALRAAFKAIIDSKQVAILVPTTILAQQHYNTLSERFSKYPIKVEMLSRFRTKKQQEKIVDDLRKGLLDMVVGTHRLLSQDVKFKDLGLLIVDEEQRFGVRHKEKTKALKKNVDVLTLTATPIPRTLHMSMLGVRDLSIIEDPPEDRYPIQTYVMEFRENIIKEAIEREIDRGGQVFFVYNVVKDIDLMTEKIRKLVPDIRVEYAHGQMSEKRLSDVMLGFLNHEFDVLISTTIIETGLDISNVNTIIIYHADKMGLSQLYQLRGRVGRSNRVAYAYLTYNKNKLLTEVAQKRLMAIKEFTELGSGFKIAMRDLQIRGAGNLLGSQQHGHMEAIGYELYVKLLEEKMESMKGIEKPIQVETSIDIQVDSYIPASYIEDVSQKLEIYKKISTIENREDLYAVEEEIEDRFGEIPQSIYNLLTISHIRGLASKIPFSNISQVREGFILDFHEQHFLSPEKIVNISKEYPRGIKVNAGNRPHILLYYNNQSDRIRNKLIQLESFLVKISSLNK